MLNDSSLPDRLRAVLDRTWLPIPGSLAADLGNHHRRGRCHARTLRDLRRLARLGFHRDGWWWIGVLDARADCIDPTDRQWIIHAWDELGAGRSPWPRKRRAA